MTGIEDIPTHLAAVSHSAQVTPGVRRITFTGTDLATFESISPDQFVYLLLPPPGRDELTIGRDFDWISYYSMPEEEQPVGAYYTVRHHRPERCELDLDFVLHDDPGPASSFALRARPGDPVALWGPRTAFTPGDGVDWYLLVADETGLPGAAAILDHLDGCFDGRVVVIVEVAGPEEHQPLAAGPAVDVTWLHRGDRPAGTTMQLADAVRALDLPAGRPYVWGGGESRAMGRIRRYLRREIGYARDDVSLTPYWRHAAHPEEPDDDADGDDEAPADAEAADSTAG
jgi:NADPH-dependent ferric siderophore reductase